MIPAREISQESFVPQIPSSVCLHITNFCYREEERHVQKRKKRRAKGPSRLSFAEEFEGDTDEDESIGNCMNLLTLSQ